MSTHEYIDFTGFKRVFCIGRNYSEHVKELDNEVPSSPVVFMKPGTSLVLDQGEIPFPSHGKELHHETEIVILIGKEGKASSESESQSFIKALTLGLDLTLRDIQSGLKSKGLPWEKAKAFDYSAPVGKFVPFNSNIDLKNIQFTCSVNGIERQNGNSKYMLFSIETLIVELSKIWKLNQGDLIFTGTPSGVAALEKGDRITIKSPITGQFSWKMV